MNKCVDAHRIDEEKAIKSEMLLQAKDLRMFKRYAMKSNNQDMRNLLFIRR